MPVWIYMLVTCFATACFAFYAYVLISAYAGLRQSVQQNSPYSYQPSVSIVIPFRDEGEKIVQLLKDLARQFYPPSNYEVVLVDDHSRPAHLDYLRTYLERTSVRNILLYRNPGRGKKSALAHGMTKAHSSIILQTDADCRLPDNWINEMVQPFHNGHIQLVLGNVKMENSTGFWSTFAALDFMSLMASGLGLALNRRAFMGSAANMAYRKKAWLEHSDKEQLYSSGDDTFLIQSMAKSDISMIEVASLEASSVRTEAPHTAVEFIEQRMRWGGKAKNYQSAFAKVLAVDVFLVNASLLGLVALSLFYSSFWSFTISLLLTKFFIDFGLLRLYAKRSGQQQLLKLYPLIALLYPLYICLTSLLILFMPGLAKWKGDKLVSREKVRN